MRPILISSPLLALALAAPASAQITAEFPFFDGFEGGTLEPHWKITKQWGDGKATVTNGNGPYSGSFHMILDGPSASLDSNVTADLVVDLSNASSVLLEFAVKDYGDEYATTPNQWLGAGNHYYDGVFISDDGGTSWAEIFKLNDTFASGTYQKHTIDLDTATANAGMTYNAQFIVRFSWEDEYAVTTDGFSFDEVTLRSLDYATIANIQSSSPTLNGHFGTSMVGIADANGDGFPDLAVGHPGYSSNRGRVEIYSGLTGDFLSQTTTSIFGDQFGSSLANLGDLNGNGSDEILIGAPYNDQNGTSAGAAYIYDTSNGVQIRAFYGDAAGDELGRALCAVPDVTGDGRDEICLASPFANGAAGVDVGRVVVYSGSNYATLMTAEGGQQAEQMGTSVDAFGDIDGDGLADVIAGSPDWDLVPFLNDNVGAAHVFSSATGLVVRSFTGDFSNADFGRAVLGAGDLNGDDVGDWLVGAPDHDATRGKVRFFSGSDGALLKEDTGKAIGERFGYNLTRAGDIDGDGDDDVAAGSNSSALGTARVYQIPSLDTLVDIEPIDSQTGFGRAIAGIGDLNQDGLGDMAVGAPDELVASTSKAGRVRVVSTADAPNLTGVVGVHSTLSGQAVLTGTNLLANLQVRVDGTSVPVHYVSPVEALIDLEPVEPGGFFDIDVATDLGSSGLTRGLPRYPAIYAPATAPLDSLVDVELDNGEPGSYLLAFSGEKYASPAPFEAWGWYYGLELNGVWFISVGNFTVGDTAKTLALPAPSVPALIGETFHLQAWTYQADTNAIGFTDTMSVTITN